MKRRHFLHCTGLGAASAALPTLCFTNNVLASTNVNKQLFHNDRACLFTIDGINSFAMRTNAGLVVVDSGSAANASLLMRELHEFSGVQDNNAVHTLFNTHYHADQTGGNETFGKAGAEIISHKKTQLHLSTDYYLPREERYHRASAKIAQPGTTFYDTLSITVGDTEIDAGYLICAHTVGDIYVYFKDANVLCVGDVVSPERDPATDWYAGAWLGGRRDSLDLILSLGDDDTRIIPAYGKPMTKRDVAAEQTFIVAIYEEISKRLREGQSAKDMLEGGIMSNFDRELQDPYQFLYDAYKGFWGHYNKIAPNIV